MSALVVVDPVKAAASDFDMMRWRVARDAGRRWFADLAKHDRRMAWAIYDDGFDWRDWFDDKPARGFKAGVESAADDVDGWAL